MTPQELQQAVNWAKKNQDDPRAKELRRRIESGLLNPELQKAGMKTFEVEAPPKPTTQYESPIGPQMQQKANTGAFGPFDVGISRANLKERFGDIKETVQGVGGVLKGGKDTFMEASQQDIRGEISTGAGLTKAIGAGVLGTIANISGELFTGAGKLALTQEAEDEIKEIAEGVGTYLSETEAVKQAVNWYEKQSPETKAYLEGAGGVAAFVTEFVGLKGGGKMVREGLEQTADVTRRGMQRAGEGLKVASDVAREGAEVVGRKADELLETRRVVQVSTQQQKVDNAVARILQKDVSDFQKEQARRALTELDTTGVKTYGELNDLFDDRISALSRKVDDELAKLPDPIPQNQWVKTTKVGDEIVTENPLKDALDSLENAYTKSGEPTSAARIRQIKSKLENDGLTVKEANDLAREYGIEFKNMAFTKLGDPKTGFNAENFENVRKGVKEAVRDKMPDDTTKLLDRNISDIYTTKQLTQKMETKVNELRNRIKNRTFAQKLGGFAAQLADLATFGALRGFVAKVLPSNMGNKVMNSLEIEAELRRNLKELDRLLKMKDDAKFEAAFQKWADNLEPNGQTPN